LKHLIDDVAHISQSEIHQSLALYEDSVAEIGIEEL
jgi:hypothetical protein